ncbi:MAG: hypothetical protein KKG47_02075 [Proteobacteria bacterium]|nr:hypothetical protein [Pseudomonadota bacterium]
MQPNIDQILAYEIKKEIADRYFGFRKLIEDDKQSLEEKVRQYSFILEKRIVFDLLRIYTMLADDVLIMDFLEIVGLDSEYFYAPALHGSELVNRRVFEGVRFRGFSRKAGFFNLLMDCYERLTAHSEMYRHKFAELMEMRTLIADEIRQFYRQNDLGTILGFLHSLGNRERCRGMDGGMEIGLVTELEKKMAVTPPLPIEQYLPVVPPLPLLAEIRAPLKELAGRAWKQSGGDHIPGFSEYRPLLSRLFVGSRTGRRSEDRK